MSWEICRVCMLGGNLVSLFDCDENNELLSHKFSSCCSIDVSAEDNLPSLICLTCVDKLLTAYQFRQQCILANETLTECISEFKLTSALTAPMVKPYDSKCDDNAATELIRIKRDNGTYLEYEIPIEDGDFRYPRIEETSDRPHRRGRGRPKKYLSKQIDFSTYEKQKKSETPQKSPSRSSRNAFSLKFEQDDSDVNIDLAEPEFLRKQDGLSSRPRRKKLKTRRGSYELNDIDTPKSEKSSKIKVETKDFESDIDEDMEPLSTLFKDDVDHNYSSDPDYNPDDNDHDVDDEKDKSDDLFEEESILSKLDMPKKQERKSTTEVSKKIRGKRRKRPFDDETENEQDDEEDLLLKETILAAKEPIPDTVMNPKPKQKKKYVKKNYSYDKAFTCDQCGKSFTKNHSLQAHIRRHLGIKPFVCNICGAAFVINLELRRHMLRHTGVRPYQCKYCERRFGDFGGRQDHERLHLGERPYKCTLCNKSFTYSSVLANHKLTHTGEKKYACEPCNRRFTKAHHLKYHNKVHHKELYLKIELETKEKKMRQQQMLMTVAQQCTEQIMALGGVKSEQILMQEIPLEQDQVSDHQDLHIAEEDITDKVVGELPDLNA